MGLFPLKAGKARIFIQDGSGSSAFLGEDWAGLTPIDDRMRLFLGDAQDVVCTRKIKTNKRHEIRGNLFNQEITITYELENFKDKPVNLKIVEQSCGGRPGLTAGRSAGSSGAPERHVRRDHHQSGRKRRHVLSPSKLPPRSRTMNARSSRPWSPPNRTKIW
jgi:hypothetical protein